MGALKQLIRTEWNPITTLVNSATIIGLIVTHKVFSDWPFERTIFILVCILLVNFCVLVFIAYSKAISDESGRKFKVIRMVKGEGFLEGHPLIELESSPHFEVNQLLTMYCYSSGATQPICILQIVEKNEKSALCQFDISDETIVRKYFEEEARRISLFATSKLTQLHKDRSAK